VKFACWNLALERKVLMRQELTKIHSTQSRFARFLARGVETLKLHFSKFWTLDNIKVCHFQAFFSQLHFSYIKRGFRFSLSCTRWLCPVSQCSSWHAEVSRVGMTPSLSQFKMSKVCANFVHEDSLIFQIHTCSGGHCT
jgi:hypothetical protein